MYAPESTSSTLVFDRRLRPLILTASADSDSSETSVGSTSSSSTTSSTPTRSDVSFIRAPVEYNEAQTLETLFLKDFRRLQRMHSWYKRIGPIEGVPFVIHLAIGEQTQNSICFDEVDTVGLHWHFVPVRHAKTLPSGIRRYTITLGPFLRGVESDGHFMGIDSIRANNPHLERWLSMNYPNISVDEVIHENEGVCAKLAHDECVRYLTNALPVVIQYIHEQGSAPSGRCSHLRYDVLG